MFIIYRACLDKSCAVVCYAVWIFHSVGKLMFDNIWADMKNLDKDRPGRSPEFMACYFAFAVPLAAQRGKNGVVAHGQGTAAGQRFYLLQNLQRLSRQGDRVQEKQKKPL
jgi:hypothetical protein